MPCWQFSNNLTWNNEYLGNFVDSYIFRHVAKHIGVVRRSYRFMLTYDPLPWLASGPRAFNMYADTFWTINRGDNIYSIWTARCQRSANAEPRQHVSHIIFTSITCILCGKLKYFRHIESLNATFSNQYNSCCSIDSTKPEITPSDRMLASSSEKCRPKY